MARRYGSGAAYSKLLLVLFRIVLKRSVDDHNLDPMADLQASNGRVRRSRPQFAFVRHADLTPHTAVPALLNSTQLLVGPQ